MKMNGKKRRKVATAVCLLLMISMFTAPTVIASSEKYEEAGGRYARISIFSIDLTISPSDLSAPYSGVRLTYSTDTADMVMELQQLNGSKWTTIKSWSTSGNGYFSLDKIWYVLPGYTYRTYTTVYVYNSSGKLLETAFATSNTVKH